MRKKIALLDEEVKQFTAAGKSDVEEFRIRFLGKKGLINALFDDFRQVAPEDRKQIGGMLNGLKNAAQEKLEILSESLEKTSIPMQDTIDLSCPGETEAGSRHPLSIIRRRMVDIFSRMGYVVYEGPGD